MTDPTMRLVEMSRAGHKCDDCAGDMWTVVMRVIGHPPHGCVVGDLVSATECINRWCQFSQVAMVRRSLDG